MSEDLDLLDRFEPLASATFVPTTGVDVLWAEATRRRRRHQLRLGGAMVAVVVLAGVLAAVALPSAPRPSNEVRSVGPVPTTIPASVGTGPRLVLGVVPPDLASHGCGVFLSEGELAACELGNPTHPDLQGILVMLKPVAKAAEAQVAWDQRDADAVLTFLHVEPRPAEFTTVGGRTVLVTGAAVPMDEPGLIRRDLKVMIDGYVLEVYASGVTEEQLDKVVGGLSIDPVDLGFAIPDGVLPSGTRTLAEEQQRLWYEPDALEPHRSSDKGGAASGITYSVPGVRALLTVSVVRDVDAESYLAALLLEKQQEQPADRADVEEIDPEGRSGWRLRRPYEGVAGEDDAPFNDFLAVAADERTVVLVDGSMPLASTLLDIAGRTVIAGAAPTPTSTTEVARPLAPEKDLEVSAGPGWFVPADLPEGWDPTRAVVQGVDGSGQAQLWLTSPTGNELIVTLRVPDGSAWRSGDAVLHPLPDVDRAVYAEPTNGEIQGALVSAGSGAIVRIDWMAPSDLGAETPPGPQAAGAGELDLLMASLRAVDVQEWRAYLGTIPSVPTPLLTAATLEALPDET